MDSGSSLVTELRQLDPGAGRTTVASAALAGLPAAMVALLGPGAGSEQHEADRERVLLTTGPLGAVACIWPTRARGDVAVVHSCASLAVRALAEHLGGSVGEAQSAEGLRQAVPALLVALNDVAVAAGTQAAHRLHDGPVQELTAAQLLMESALPADHEDADGLVRGLEALRAAILSTRQLMAELSGDA
jgi:signal transduction histidine kinase